MFVLCPMILLILNTVLDRHFRVERSSGICLFCGAGADEKFCGRCGMEVKVGNSFRIFTGSCSSLSWSFIIMLLGAFLLAALECNDIASFTIVVYLLFSVPKLLLLSFRIPRIEFRTDKLICPTCGNSKFGLMLEECCETFLFKIDELNRRLLHSKGQLTLALILIVPMLLILLNSMVNY